jgi:hypothetical protein
MYLTVQFWHFVGAVSVRNKRHVLFLGTLSQVLPNPGELLTVADSS